MRSLFATTLVAVASLALAASCGAAVNVACSPRGSKPLASDHAGTVFVMHGVVYGCLDRPRARRYRLGSSSSCHDSLGRVGLVAAAGALVAYALTRCGVDTAPAQIVVRRLSNGKPIRTERAVALIRAEAFVSVDALVLEADGAVGWIATELSLGSHSSSREVHRADSSGNSVLDSGSGIDIHSLRLRGSTMSWRDGDAQHAAHLS